MRTPLTMALAALALAACKDYPASSTTPPGDACGVPVERADAGHGFIEADCAWRERCGFIPAGEVEACVEVHAAMGFERFIDERLNDSRLAYDAAAMACCVEDLASFPCVYEPEPPSCSLAARGTVPFGGACREHFHCDRGQCNEGTCEPLPGTGESCFEVCTEGNVCSWDEDDEGYTGMCVPLAAEGEPCVPYDRPCLPELACYFDWSEGTGACRQPAKEGERCSDELLCASATLYCALDEDDVYTGTCTRRVGLGEPCSYIRAESLGGCVIGLICDSLDYEGTGTCVAPPGEGESCAEIQRCAYPLACLPNGTCGRMLFDGEPCGDREDLCVHGECIGGICTWLDYE